MADFIDPNNAGYYDPNSPNYYMYGQSGGAGATTGTASNDPFGSWVAGGMVGEPQDPNWGGWGGYNLYQKNKAAGTNTAPTFVGTATDEQKAQVAALKGGSYTGADPKYLDELQSGWTSGKYSFEDLTDAYGRLTTQGAAAPAGAAPTDPTDPVESAPQGGLSQWDTINQMVKSGYTDRFTNPNQGEVYNLVKSQLSYVSRRLGDIEQARKLADMTGTLTSDEKKMFDEMETSAVDNLKSQVNKQSAEVWDAAIADMVNRGVLQGTVGTKILSTIGEETNRMIGEGVNTIRGQKNAQMLSMVEGNKNRALTWQQMLSSEAGQLLGIGQGYSGQISNESMTSENRALQNALAELSAKVGLTGIASNEYLGALGIESQEGIAAANRGLQWDIASMSNLTNQQQLANQLYGYNLDAQTRLAISNMQSNAATTGSKYNAGGNLLAFGTSALMKYLNSGSSSTGGDPTSTWTDPSQYTYQGYSTFLDPKNIY